MPPSARASRPAAISLAISYASSHGIVVSSTPHAAAGTHLTHAPMTHLPSPLPSVCHAHALRITPPLNLLVARLAADAPYLRAALARTAAADPAFTARLLALLAPPNPHPQRVRLALTRFDYFVHDDPANPALRMVEMNCIAASFACLAARTSRMHRHLSNHPALAPAARLPLAALPANDSDNGMARGLAAAHLHYCKLYAPETALAVMIVQPGERNAYDQDLLRIALWDNHAVEMVRLSLADIAARARVDPEGRLLVTLPAREHAEEEVSVVYFRAGYSPDDYPEETQWAARELLERSIAAKCPSVAMQLVGTKKIQQVLDRPGEVERFVGDADAADIRATFAGQWSLQSDEGGEEAARMAIDRPDDFVLKPQREGGGNNLYGEDMKHALQKMGPEERSAYVLMERIRPVVVRNVLIRDGDFEETDIVSEFGVFGVHVSVDGEEVENYAAGTLMRSKAASQDDGGVAAGVAVLDSPVLIE